MNIVPIKVCPLFFSILMGLGGSLFLLSACADLSSSQNTTTNDQMEALTIHQLSKQQQEDWTTLFDKWQFNEFRACLEAHDFKMDCIDCGSIYLDATLSIGENGQLSHYDVQNEEIDCQDKTPEQIKNLKECILDFFIKYTFPESLRNTKLEVRLGRATRC